MSERETFVTCHCQHCNGHIEFNAKELSDETNVTQCPHCGMETRLFIPKAAKRIQTTGLTVGGIEQSLDKLGDFFLALGILGAIGAIIGALIAFDNPADTGIGVELICVAVGLIFSGAVTRIWCRAAAELIRLLKKSNGLKFSGSISQPNTIDRYTCSACNSVIYSSSSEKCLYCGAKFE